MDNDEGRFGVVALRWMGEAALILGWRPEEFWRATPAEFWSVLAAMAGRGADGGGETGWSAARLGAMMEAFPDG